ncbi:hypothetical protein [Novosphingobium sp. PY1]|uniref:hypothetical protein n=1 Tax=Novosphingobium sp. PY1 TaxID=1882221 RepID=UPI001A8E8DFF|nr:hypothetical protein [Novosphingobium sp. PY1]GFM30708.1 uncharacterized protein PY1_contig-12-69 [Novosphingobium sp. PY1]
MPQIEAYFSARADADIAAERLVQQYGIARPDIFLEPAGGSNSEGLVPSGGDSPDERSHDAPRKDGALYSSILLSVDVDAPKTEEIREILISVGAKLRD